MRVLCFSFICFFNSLQQSSAQNVRNLVFEGAGIRGIAYSGAIEAMEKQGILSGVQRVGGTSSGGITALLLSIGYTGEEIREIIYHTPFKKFNDGRFFFAGGINRFRKYFGWYRGKKFEKWIARLIEKKTGNADIRFRELKEKGFKDLYITGTSLIQQKMIVFSHENYPEMRIRDAVRISMSIPLYFEAVFLDSSGQIIYHPKNKEGLDVMADGGLTGNFPIRMFDSTKYLGITGKNQFTVNAETIGFRIDRSIQVDYDKKAKGLAPMEIGSLTDYFGAFYNIVVENLNRQILTKEDWARTVSISDGDIQPRIRKLSRTELNSLTGNGAKAYEEFRKQAIDHGP